MGFSNTSKRMSELMVHMRYLLARRRCTGCVCHSWISIHCPFVLFLTCNLPVYLTLSLTLALSPHKLLLLTCAGSAGTKAKIQISRNSWFSNRANLWCWYRGAPLKSAIGVTHVVRDDDESWRKNWWRDMAHCCVENRPACRLIRLSALLQNDMQISTVPRWT